MSSSSPTLVFGVDQKIADGFILVAKRVAGRKEQILVRAHVAFSAAAVAVRGWAAGAGFSIADTVLRPRR